MTLLSLLTLSGWRDRDKRDPAPLRVKFAYRTAELIPDAMGRPVLLLRLTDTTTGDYVDAIVQAAMLEDASADQRLQDTLETLEAELCG